MKRLLLSVAVLSCAILMVSAAHADSMAFSVSGDGLTASGTFYGSPVSPGQWLVTAVSGTFNGSAISAIEPLTNSGNVFSFNNIYYWPAPVTDLFGIVFDLANGDRINLCFDSGCFGSPTTYTAIVWDPNVGLTGLDAQTYNFGPPVADSVPEPGTLALLGTGLVGLGGLLRRKLRV